jgi:hypothetical protein
MKGIQAHQYPSQGQSRRRVTSLTLTDDEQFALRIDGTVELWQRSHSENNPSGIPPRHGMKRVFDDPKAVAGAGEHSDHPSTHPLGLESFGTENDQVQLCACNAAEVVVDPQPDPPRVGRSTILCLQAKGTNKGTGIDGALKQDETTGSTRYYLCSDVAGNRVAVVVPDRETVLSTLKLPSKFEDQEFGTRPADSIATTSVANSGRLFLSSDVLGGASWP